MGRRAIADYGVEGWIHLDHGGSVELVARCLDAGFDSVMIDASECPFEENVATTRRVVELARPYGANVEAELGYVAKLGQTQGGGFTTPDEAARFVEATGVDALAVSIGSAHGFYKQAPKLDIERLAQIRAATDVALVLHGSSGIPHEMVREAIANGIVKVNLATEIKDNFMRALKQALLTSDEIDLRKVFPAPSRRSSNCCARNTALREARRTVTPSRTADSVRCCPSNDASVPSSKGRMRFFSAGRLRICPPDSAEDDSIPTAACTAHKIRDSAAAGIRCR